MTTFHDVDWRISSTSKIIRTISDSINDVYKNRKGEKDIYRTKEEMRLIDELVGISFIVVQMYINGTLADVKMFSEEPNRISRDTLLKNYSDLLPDTTITKMELCYAMANYIKHHEEWHNWSEGRGGQNITVKILRAVGIDQDGIEPIQMVTELLLTTERNFDLEPLISLIIDWRTRVMSSINV